MYGKGPWPEYPLGSTGFSEDTEVGGEDRSEARSLSDVEGSTVRSAKELDRLAEALLAAVGGTVERGGKSCTILRCENEGISAHCRYSDSMAVSKYDPRFYQLGMKDKG